MSRCEWGSYGALRRFGAFLAVSTSTIKPFGMLGSPMLFQYVSQASAPVHSPSTQPTQEAPKKKENHLGGKSLQHLRQRLIQHAQNVLLDEEAITTLVTVDSTNGLFKTHSKKISRAKATITAEESMTLLSHLMAMLLKERLRSVLVGNLYLMDTTAQPQPVDVSHAITAPIVRQEQLWRSLRVWRSLVRCAGVTFSRLQASATTDAALRDGLAVMLNRLDALDTPTEMRNERRLSSHISVAALLVRLAMSHRLMSALMLGNTAQLDLQRTIRSMATLLEHRTYSVSPTESAEGLFEVLQYALRAHAAAHHHSRYLGEALVALIAAYCETLPNIVAASPTTSVNTATKEKTCGFHEVHGVVFLQTLRECWLEQQSLVRAGSVQAAMWWLRLVPVLMEALVAVSAQAQADNQHMKTIQTELVSILSAMLYFNEADFAERQVLAASHANGKMEKRSDDSDASCDNDGMKSIADNKNVNSGDSNGVAAASGVRPRRGGRSLFKKDSGEGVLLPSSSDVSRKASRFTSRREWTSNSDAIGSDQGTNGELNGPDGEVERSPNSPLFDLIVSVHDTVSRLSSMYAIEALRRGAVLEGTWLSLLRAHRRGRESFTPHSATGSVSDTAPLLPPFVLHSIEHISGVLAHATQQLHDVAGSFSTRDENIRRCVGVALVAGAHESLLHNSFFIDGFGTNWWFRTMASADVVLETALMHLVTQRTRWRHDAVWLQQATEIALNCLGSASRLSPCAKQWASAFVLANITSITRLQEENSSLEAWTHHALTSLLALLTEDRELLLISSYASFLDVLYELRLFVTQKMIIDFVDKVLLRVLPQALAVALAKSAEEDTAETHVSACEATLLVLGGLSRFALRPYIRMRSVTTKPSEVDGLLMSLALYCLRFVRSGAAREVNLFGLSPPQLPSVVPPDGVGEVLEQLLRSRRGAGKRKTSNKCEYSYLHLLDLSNGLCSLNRVHPLFTSRVSASVSALGEFIQGMQLDPTPAHRQEVLNVVIRSMSVSVGSQSPWVLGSLVRFMGYYLRQQEWVARVLAEESEVNVTHVSTMARVEEAPLLLIDFMGQLNTTGSWVTVLDAFSVAETSLRIQRKYQLTTSNTSIREAAQTAILAQLRVLTVPVEEINMRMLPPLQLVIIHLADVMADAPTTAFFFERGSHLHGLFRQASRGEYRVMFFALKQAVVFVHRVSMRYRGSTVSTTSSMPKAGRGQGGEEEEKEEDVEIIQPALEGGGQNDRMEPTRCYFDSDAPDASTEALDNFRSFLCSAVVCFDCVLDAIRFSALKQDVLDEELREVLILCLHTLLHVFQGTIRALLQSSDVAKFRAEQAALTWASLVVAAIIGRAVSVDHQRVCFAGPTRLAVKSLLGSITELIDSCVTGAGVAKTTTTPLLDVLLEALGQLHKNRRIPHHVALRLGLFSRHRRDLTALIHAMRCFASAAARYARAGEVVHHAWKILSEELAKNATPTRKRRGTSKQPDKSLPAVSSREKLRQAFESFVDLKNELHEYSSTRQAHNRESKFVMEWPCMEAAQIVDAVPEDTSLHSSTESIEDDRDEADSVMDDSTSAITTSTSALLGASAPTELEASFLLDEEDGDAEEGQSGIFTRGGHQGTSRLVSSSEAMSALARQSSSIFSASTTQRVALTHIECVMRVLQHYPFVDLVASPGGHTILRSLQVLVRQKLAVPPKRRQELWALISSRWQAECMPTATQLDTPLCALLTLVRQRRSLQQSSSCVWRGGTTGVSASPKIRLFGTKDNALLQLAHHEAPATVVIPEMPCHDDPRDIAEEDREEESVNFPMSMPLPLRVPLRVTFSMLSTIYYMPREEMRGVELARTIVMYAAQQHVLLRPRLDGDVTNVYNFLYDEYEALESILPQRQLPSASLHAGAVSGWFLSDADRSAVEHALAEKQPFLKEKQDTKTKSLVIESQEQNTFIYIRTGCVYLHLLALIIGVGVRHRVFDDPTTFIGRSMTNSGGSSREYGNGKGRNGHGGGSGRTMEEMDEESDERSSPEARLEERRRLANTRQMDAELVRAHPFETVLLSFVNVASTLLSHTDAITHRATSIAVATDEDTERARKALLYADELRLMVATTLQKTLHALRRDAQDGFHLLRRAAHAIVGGFSCDAVPTSLTGTAIGHTQGQRQEQQQEQKQQLPSQQECDGAHEKQPHALRISPSAFEAWRSKRPELFVRSPTLLCVMSPPFVHEVLSQSLRIAPGHTVTQVVASLHFHLRRPDAQLGPLMAATTTILSCTSVRNAALRLYCDAICAKMVSRESFRSALAPPTVASVSQSFAASVPNEILIPFLAAVSREDVSVAKHTLAAALHCAMHLRSDVFGQPPTADRFARLSISRGRVASSISSKSESMAKRRLSLGLNSTDVQLESPLSPSEPQPTNPSAVTQDNHQEQEQEQLDALVRFRADLADQTATRTHKRALAALHLTVPEVMETAMHFAQLRRPTLEEHRKGLAMIYAADNARRERIEAFRSAAPIAAATNPSSHHGEETSLGHPDAALRLEDPTHFGVVLLHLRFALRKIIHISMRRLAPQQRPRGLSIMIEMLRAVDPKWQRGNESEQEQRQSDGMLAGTLRLLLARAMTCVELIQCIERDPSEGDEENGKKGSRGEEEEEGGGGVAPVSAAGMQRAERALYLTEKAAKSRVDRAARYISEKGKGIKKLDGKAHP